MAVCHKSWKELAVALVILILIATSTGFNVLGAYWNEYNIKHGMITGRTYVIVGNILSVFATFAAMAIVSLSLAIKPTAVYILVLMMLLGLVVDLYFTMFAEDSVVGDAFAYAILGLNAIPRFVAVLLGYGVCTIPDAIAAARVFAGGRRIR
jgi:hypothetical protein